MHFTIAGLLALATAVAATPLTPVANPGYWHATPDIDISQLDQRCGDLNVYCCIQVNGNGNSGLSGAGLTDILPALGFLPGTNTACAPANAGALSSLVGNGLTAIFGQRMYILYPEQSALFTYILIEQPRSRRTFAKVPPMHAAPRDPTDPAER
jgi:hypothetical protein